LCGKITSVEDDRSFAADELSLGKKSISVNQKALKRFL